MDLYVDLREESNEKMKNLGIPNIENILIFDLLTRPLAFLYAMEKLNFEVTKSMVVHVIGATDKKISYWEAYWEFVLLWLPRITTLSIIFISPEISKFDNIHQKKFHFPGESPLKKKNLRSRLIREKYASFKPVSCERLDIIVAYDVYIHDKEYGFFFRD